METEFNAELENRCLLFVAGRHFMVQILSWQDEAVSVAFPGTDYPINGMSVVLEFHDDTGYYRGSTEVMEGPTPESPKLLLKKPDDFERHWHRASCRVPTDLSVQIKDRRHLRRYDGALADIGLGGALVRTEAPFDFSTPIEMNLSLPGEPTATLVGQIAYILEPPKRQGQSLAKVFGIRFSGLSPETAKMIQNYVWRRLIELYPPL